MRLQGQGRPWPDSQGRRYTHNVPIDVRTAMLLRCWSLPMKAAELLGSLDSARDDKEGVRDDKEGVRDDKKGVRDDKKVPKIDLQAIEKISQAITKLAPNQISEHGYLMEWLEDYK